MTKKKKPAKIHCPHCNSLQQFPVKTRREALYFVYYIVCNQCKEESVLRRETPEQRLKRIRLRRQKRQ